LELFRYCSIICFYLGLWNCSDSMALFVFMRLWNCSDSVELFVFSLDIGTVPTLWYYLFFNWTLELFRQCGIICYSTGLWNFSVSVALLVFHFSIGLWNCSDIVALFIFLLDFGTVPTIWHYLFFYVTLELFDNMALFVFLCDFGTVPTIWHYLFL
jgi:hypothetical protein